MATPTLRAPYGVSSPYTVDDPGVLKNPFGLGTGGGGGTGPQGPPGPTGHGSTTTTAAPTASGGNWVFTVADTTAFVAFGTPVYCSDGTNSIYGTVVNVISPTQITVAPTTTTGTISSISNGSTFTFSGVAGPAGANASVYVGVTTNSGNTYTATPSPAIASYITGTLYTAQFNAANTGAVTLNISGLGAKNVYLNGAALTGGEIAANAMTAVTYDGTQFNMTGDGRGGSGGSSISEGAYSSRPSAGTSGRLYFATDLPVESYDNGSSWDEYRQNWKVGSLSSEILADSPTSYYKLDDASGAVTDYGSAGISLTNATNDYAFSALLPTNETQYMRLVSNGSLVASSNPTGVSTPTASWTAEAVISLISSSIYGCIFSVNNGSLSSVAIYFCLHSGVPTLVTTTSSGNQVATSNIILPVGFTYHLAVTMDTGTSKTSFFINGKKIASVAATSPTNVNLTAPKLNVGIAYGDYITGIAGHVAFYYNKVLTDSRIRAHAKAAGLYCK